MDEVGFEVSCETAVVACPLVITGGVCIAFSVLSLSTCFGGMIIHFAVCAFVLLASVSWSTTSSATSSAMAMAMISAIGVLGRFSGCICYCFG